VIRLAAALRLLALLLVDTVRSSLAEGNELAARTPYIDAVLKATP